MSSNIINFFRSAAFGPEVLHRLGEAYDSARQNVSVTVTNDEVARAVLEAAQTGERSTERLTEVAIQILYARRDENDVGSTT